MDPPLTYQITSGSLAGSDVFAGGLVRLAGENVGAYLISVGTLTAGQNYSLAYTRCEPDYHACQTSTTVSSVPNPSDWSQVVTLTTTVANTFTSVAPSGSVSFTTRHGSDVHGTGEHRAYTVPLVTVGTKPAGLDLHGQLTGGHGHYPRLL